MARLSVAILLVLLSLTMTASQDPSPPMPTTPSPSPGPHPTAPAPPPSDLAPSSSPSPAPSSKQSPVPAPAPAPGASEADNTPTIGVDNVKETPKKESGMSAGKKAGIAFAVIAGLCVVGLAGFVYKKRQKNIERSQYGYGGRREIPLSSF